MREIIISSQNKTIKYIKSLHSKKYRDDSGQYIIEGYKLVEEALEYKRPFYLLLASDAAAKSVDGHKLLNKCESMNIPVYIADEKLFNETSEMDSPQGVLAVLNKQEQSIQEIMNTQAFNLMVLDEVRDPGNVGTIIRTADACGVSAVVLSKGCADLYNGKTLRATMGSMFHIPVITDVDILTVIKELKQLEATVLGADPHSEVNCIDVKPSERMAIIIGNEARGLKDEVKAATTQNVTIPMPGKSESLNAGIAAAILMYELIVRKSI